MANFAERLKELRLEKNLNYAEMAKIIGVSSTSLGYIIGVTSTSLGYYERGERVPDIDTLTMLCKFFNVSSDYMLGIDTKTSALPNKDPETWNKLVARIAELLDENKRLEAENRQYRNTLVKAGAIMQSEDSKGNES